MRAIFGDPSSPYDEVVEKVTAETLTQENWALMMDISDRVANAPAGSRDAKQCLLAIKKRLNHRDPHVVLFALSLLDCLWNNSGQTFRREVSSNEFINELSYRATSSNHLVGEKTRSLIKKWAESDCRKDPSLSLVESLYRDLVDEGYSFESSEKPKKAAMYSNDPNVVNNEQEEADIAKAIALSLSEQKDTPRKTQSAFEPVKSKPIQETPIRKVKALYDFEAAEDNELSFNVGDLINVYDASDANWWRGELCRGSRPGLFPASFVTLDLSEEPQRIPTANTVQQPGKEAQIDEEVLKKCIDLLELCDPTGNVPDDPELLYYEQLSMAQMELVDQKLAQIDKQHNALARIDMTIRNVLAQYDDAVQQAQQGHAAAGPEPSIPSTQPVPAAHFAPPQVDPNAYAPSPTHYQPQLNGQYRAQ